MRDGGRRSGSSRPWRGLRTLGLALALAAGAGPSLAHPAGGPGVAAAPTEEDLLLFELHLDRVILSENFPAFAHGQGFLLPLGELCRVLDLAIQVDPARGVAEGFLIDERRSFRLDGKAATVTLGRVVTALDPGLLDLRADDLYLDTSLLAKCLPLTFAVANRSAVITLTSLEELPLQARWKREGGGARRPQDTAPRTFSPMADPYRLLEFPAVDAALSLGSAADPAGGKHSTAQASLLASGDLLGLTTTLSAQAESQAGTTDLHLSMGRRDSRGGLLGPLRATQFQFGEVLSPGLNLVAAPASGTGAMVSNQPLQIGAAFDRHSFQGDLPPGWQVELYQNQGLVAFQASRADGRYEFLNLPLSFGWNEFRLVFYGPQGQRREETTRFDVSSSQTPVGALHYLVVGLQPHDLGGRRSLLQASYGLTRQLAASFGTAMETTDGVRRTFAQAALQGFWKPLSGSFTAGRDAQGGSVGELALRTRLGSISLVGKQTELAKGFHSEVFSQEHGQIHRRTSLEVSAPFPSLERTWFTLDFGGYRDQLLAGGRSEVLHVRVATALGGLFLANQISRSVVRGQPLAAPVAAGGEFLASKAFPGLALRGQATYSLHGGRGLDAAALAVDLSRWEPWLLQAGVTRSLRGRQTTVNLGLVKNQGVCSLGASLAYSRGSRLSASLTLRAGLALEPRGRRWFSTAQGTAAFGAVSAEAFLDANGNGIRDAGERALADAAFLVNGASHPRRTDARGIVFLDGLPMDVDANIALAPGTLEDPLMRPQRPGAQVTARPGHVARLEVPVVLLGEISGTAYRLQAGQRLEQPGVRLELRDAAGRVVKSLRSAYDGFYVFSELAPGAYTLEVSADAARQLGVAAPPPRVLTLAPEGTMLDGVDLLLGVREAETVVAGLL